MKPVLRKPAGQPLTGSKKYSNAVQVKLSLNCMNQDGVRQGYDIDQLSKAREICTVPLIASGGAGAMEHFKDVYQQADVDGALAASVFHKAVIDIQELKTYLIDNDIAIRR